MSVGTAGELVLARETEIEGAKPFPVPLCSTQVPNGLAWDLSQASAVTCRIDNDVSKRIDRGWVGGGESWVVHKRVNEICSSM